MTRIIIEVLGGVVSSVYADAPILVDVLDWDNDEEVDHSVLSRLHSTAGIKDYLVGSGAQMSDDNLHWLVTAHAEDREDETHYVIAQSATQAEDLTKAWIRKQADEDTGRGFYEGQVYVTMVAELSGPPLTIYEGLVRENPQPLRP